MKKNHSYVFIQSNKILHRVRLGTQSIYKIKELVICKELKELFIGK